MLVKLLTFWELGAVWNRMNHQKAPRQHLGIPLVELSVSQDEYASKIPLNPSLGQEDPLEKEMATH